jgi:DNA-binding response OmpR family regulator
MYPARGEADTVTSFSGKTVLCISDDPIRLNLRCAALKECGLQLLTATSGHDGILRCNRETVDAVILDLGGDGAESALIVAEVKRLHPGLPVIMLVAAGSHLVRNATAQADAVVKQSKNPADLLAALRSAIGNS